MARAAGYQVHTPQRLRQLGADANLGAVDIALHEIHAAAKGGFDDIGLLVDFLEHEMFVARLLGLHRTPVDSLHAAFDLLPANGLDARSRRAQLGDVAVFQEDHLAGVGQERWDITATEGLAVANAHHKRRAVARGDDHVGLGTGDHRNGVGADDLRERLPDGLKERGRASRKLAMDQVRNDLRVGVREEPYAAALQLVP